MSKLDDAAQRARDRGEADTAKKTAAAARASRPFTVLTPADCEAGDPRRYVIKGLIAEADHAQIIGLPGCGKSALGPLAGYCLARGDPFFGRRVRRGAVLYFAPEDGHGMRLRIRALRKRLGDAPDFLMIPEPLNLMDPDSGDIERMLKLVRDYQPVAVFIDTVAKAFPGLKENDNDSMDRVVRAARILTQEACQPAVITIHHVTKDGGSTPRGSGVLFGDLDSVLLIEGEKAEVRKVSVGKNRNGPSDATFAFNIETEDFGSDADGDPITAVIAAPVKSATSARNPQAEANLAPQQTLMLREIRDLIERHGELIEPGLTYPTVRAVTRNLLRSRLVDRGWFAENLLRPGSGGKMEMDRKAYTPENHALTKLKAKSLASFNREYVWLL